MRTWRAAVFTLVQRVARGLDLVSRGLVYLGAGVLRQEDLRWAITKRWQGFGSSQRFALSGLMSWEEAFYPRFLKPDDEILVVGSGSGRDLLALLRAGYRVEGIEPAAGAAALARATLVAQGLDARVEVGRIETATLAKRYDVYIFSWYCYSYIPQRATRVAVLAKVRDHLRPAGRILLSYALAEHPPRGLPLVLTRVVGRLTRSHWRPEPTDVFRMEGPGLHFEHLFRPEEIEDEARAAGLTVAFHHWDDDGTAVLTVAVE